MNYAFGAQPVCNHPVHHYPESFCYDSIWHEISPRSRGTDRKKATDNTKCTVQANLEDESL